MDPADEDRNRTNALIGNMITLLGIVRDFLGQDPALNSLDDLISKFDNDPVDSVMEELLSEDILTILSRFQRSRLIREIADHGLLTNDVVQLMGDTWELRINGSRPIQLKHREFLFLYVLARHRQKGGRYLTVHEIVDHIDRLLAKDKKMFKSHDTEDCTRIWPYITSHDIHRVTSELKRKIKSAGFNEKLIQPAARKGAGYRLSTSAQNIDIVKTQRFADHPEGSVDKV